MENMVANLIYSSSPTPPVRPVQSIQSLTKAVTDINGYFAITNLPSLLEIINIYSEDTDPALRVSLLGIISIVITSASTTNPGRFLTNSPQPLVSHSKNGLAMLNPTKS